MGLFGKFHAVMFAMLLAKPFNKWDAFKLGIIDEKGNIIKKPVSSEEKSSMDLFENLIRKIKKILLKFVPDNKYLNFLVSAYLLKEDLSKNEEIIKEELEKELTYDEQEILYDIMSKNLINYEGLNIRGE